MSARPCSLHLRDQRVPVKFTLVKGPLMPIVCDVGVNVYRFADGVTVYVKPDATLVNE